MTEQNVQQKILQTFHELAIIYGLKKISIDQLAKECGISKKTIYKNFKGKKDIIDHFVNDIIETLNDEVYKTQLMEDNPEKLLLKFFDIIFALVQNIPPTVADDVTLYYPDIEEKIAWLREHYSKVFLDIIKKGISLGLFREINPRFLEGFYDAVVNRVFTPEFIAANQLTVQESLNSFKTLLLQGLLRYKEA